MLKTNSSQWFEAVVIGSSAGGIKALTQILSTLPENFPLPIVIVQHLHPQSNNYISQILANKCKLTVRQAEEKESISPGIVYLAPPAYHLLIEEDRSFSLSLDAPVKYARPSVDVLFETAMYAYRQHLIAVILTGANSDGCDGVRKIKSQGGYIIVQDPKTAEAETMPDSAIKCAKVDKILHLDDIGAHLLHLAPPIN